MVDSVVSGTMEIVCWVLAVAFVVWWSRPDRHVERLEAELEELAVWCETSQPLYSSRQGTAEEAVLRERAAAAKRIRNAVFKAKNKV